MLFSRWVIQAGTEGVRGGEGDDLGGGGNAPVERERLKMWVREHRMEEEGARRSCVGAGSRGQVVRRASEKTLVTSSVVARLKERSVGEVKVCGMLDVVGGGRAVARSEEGRVGGVMVGGRLGGEVG
ncbi:unnamed protein product [Staurois parvus]|uniref:Uncharacterized protein n=1 Tax=Staurois parvus TaxID=386267 RepID=A0ABN9CGS3_9NEOB|nr:unnamed protein product [Staurois parvus]